MDKAVMQQVPAMREKKEVLPLLAESVPPQRIGFKTYLAKKRKQEGFFNLFIMALV